MGKKTTQSTAIPAPRRMGLSAARNRIAASPRAVPAAAPYSIVHTTHHVQCSPTTIASKHADSEPRTLLEHRISYCLPTGTVQESVHLHPQLLLSFIFTLHECSRNRGTCAETWNFMQLKLEVSCNCYVCLYSFRWTCHRLNWGLGHHDQ